MKKKPICLLLAALTIIMIPLNAAAVPPALIEPVTVGTTSSFDAGRADEETSGSSNSNTNTSSSPSPFAQAVSSINGRKDSIQDIVYRTGTRIIRVQNPDQTVDTEYNITLGQWINGNQLVQVDKWVVDLSKMLSFIGGSLNDIIRLGDGRTPSYTPTRRPVGEIGRKALDDFKGQLPTLGFSFPGLPSGWFDFDLFNSLYPNIPMESLADFLRKYSDTFNMPSPPEWVSTIIKKIRSDLVPGGFEDRESAWGRYELLMREFLSRGARDYVNTLYITEYTIDNEETQKIIRKKGTGEYEWIIHNTTNGQQVVYDRGPQMISVTFTTPGSYVISAAEYMDVTRADVATYSRDEIWVSQETGSVLWRKCSSNLKYNMNVNYSSEKIQTRYFTLEVTQDMVGRRVVMTSTTDGIIAASGGFDTERIQ